ncbi:MAG: hypothetical protein WAU00_12800 [Caldilinea sp.]
MPTRNDFCTTERVAIVTRRLALGAHLSTADVAALVGITRCGAWSMLAKLSRVAPIVQDDNGKWYILPPENSNR